MKILVCGTREPLTEPQADRVMDVLWAFRGGLHTIIHGAAPGVDTQADRFSKRMDWEVRPYPAAWEEHGKAAGPIRNQQMLDEEHDPLNKDGIDLVLAFPIKTSRGTWDMVERAVKARIPVRVYPL